MTLTRRTRLPPRRLDVRWAISALRRPMHVDKPDWTLMQQLSDAGMPLVGHTPMLHERPVGLIVDVHRLAQRGA